MFGQHLKYGARTFARQPGFTAAAVLVLAFGVGGASAIFAVVDAVMLRPLPFAEPDRLAAVLVTTPARASHLVSPLDMADLRARSRTLEDVALFSSTTATIANGDQAEPVVAYRGSASLFSVLRLTPLLGRTFTAAEDRASAERAVLLSYAFWQRRFDGDAAIVGRTVRLDGASATIVGVLPRWFAFPQAVDVWLPLALTPEQLAPMNRGAQFLQAIARLKPDVAFSDGVRDVERIGRELAHDYPDADASTGLTVISSLDYMVSEIRPGVVMLESAVAFLLLVACANVANLLLARAASRRREIAIRAALGAGRTHIVQQLLAEGLLLGAAAAAGGLLIAGWSLRALLAVIPAGFPRADAIRIDATVEGFALALAAASACLASLAPAFGAGRANLVEALNGARNDGSAPGGGRRMQQAFIAVQVAASLVLLVGAGLSIRTLWALTTTEPGFRSSGVLSARIALPRAYGSAASVRFFDRLVHAMRAEPGVAAAAAVSMAPFEPRTFGGTLTILGAPPVEPSHEPQISVRAVSGDYFRTLGIAVIAGRAIVDADARGHGVAVLSDTAARAYWPDGGALGSRIRLNVDVAEGTSMDREVVGVVHDVKLRRVNEDTPAVVYVPHAQYPSRTMTMVMRTEGSPIALAPALRREAAALDRDVALREVLTMDERVAGSMEAFRFRMRLLGVFAASALALAIVGLYSVTTYAMARRVREMGIRLALGAPADHIVRLVFMEAMRPVALGALGGGAITLALAPAVQRLVYGVGAVDPATLAAVTAVLALAAAAACAAPARRALRVDPVVALREC
jgi:putative ABC transport system permease protein